MPDPEWKDIIGYEGLYKISNHGEVKSLSRRVPCPTGMRSTAERILRPQLSGGTYSRIMLYKDGRHKTFYTHHLVAEYFGA